MAGGIRSEVERGWAGAEAASSYAEDRYHSRRAAARDLALVARLLRRHSCASERARILDVPHGAGRLRPVIERWSVGWVGLDRSASMLSRSAPAPLVLGSVEHLPFADATFDAVVCCRLLHHLDEELELPSVLRELVRVSKHLVIASFWDAASLHGWRRRTGLRADASGRRPIAKRRLEALFQGAGASVIGYAHSLRHVSLQAFAAARKPG